MSLLANNTDENVSASCSMKVVVRVKPADEENTNCSNVIQVVDDKLLIFDPPQEEKGFFFKGQRQSGYIPTKKICKDTKFMFHKVFDTTCTNEDVFLNTTEPVLKDLLNGYNCSVFAYGATGSGKTYTMLGSSADPGVMFLTSMDLFQRLHEIQKKKDCEVSVSYLEVYNETINDLLKQSPPLKLREDPELGVVIAGLSFHKPQTAEDLFSMLECGNKNRSQNCTQANSQSSRSHAVFQIHLRQQSKISGLSSSVSVSKMSLIDLAGSERATVASGQNKRLREGANINKSLLALGNCINALAAKQKQAHHVPYRDSKLTRILKDSLGGNCRTIMIANISTIPASFEETYNTLKYADRARHIHLNLTTNVVSVDAHLSNYKVIVQGLQNQVKELKEELTHIRELQNCPNITSQSNACMINTTNDLKKEEIDTTELCILLNGQEINIKKLLECESSLRRLKLKKNWKQKYMERISISSTKLSGMNLTCSKLDHTIQSHKVKEKRLHMVKNELIKKLKVNRTALKAQEEKLCCEFDVVPQAFANVLKEKQIEFETTHLKHQVMHLKHVIHFQECQVNKTENLLQEALKLLNVQHNLLENRGLLTKEMGATFDSIMKNIVNLDEVSWPDHIQQHGDTAPENINFITSLPALGHIISPLPTLHKVDITLSSSSSTECTVAKPSQRISPAGVNVKRSLFIDSDKKYKHHRMNMSGRGVKSDCSPAISKAHVFHSLPRNPSFSFASNRQASTLRKSPKADLNETFGIPNPIFHHPRFPLIELNKSSRNPPVTQEKTDSYKMKSSLKLVTKKSFAPYYKSTTFRKTVSNGNTCFSRQSKDIRKESNLQRFKFKL